MTGFRRLFVLVPDARARAAHYTDLWRRHFEEGVREGVEAVVFPEGVDFSWARAGRNGAETEQARGRASATLWASIEAGCRAGAVDGVLSYCFATDVEPWLVEKVRGLGLPWVNFYCDSTHRFEEVRELACRATLNWFPERRAEADYRALGRPWFCRPYALNPRYLPDLSCDRAERPVAFVGVPSTNRITQIGWLRLLGCRVEVRGPGWVGRGDDPFASAVPARQRAWRALLKRGLVEKLLRRVFWLWVRTQAGTSLDPQEWDAYLRGSRILLGLNQGRDASGRLRSYLKFRDIEFPGYGCCYLTNWSEDLEGAFALGREVLGYRTLAEAARVYRRLNARPEEAREVGRRGRERVLTSHTWAARLPEIRLALEEGGRA